MIQVQNLNKTYDRGSRTANQALHDISMTLPNTGFVCIVGPSGCGKTSLLNALGGLDQFDSGTISTERISVSKYGTPEMEQERNNCFGYIFQNYYLLGEHSVAYNVYLGLHALKLTHSEKIARVREALKAVNMERYARRLVQDLSGGQQQRVAIARALARRPQVIFADEPTGNLDEENTLQVCTLLRQISKTSLVIMVTHEERIARFFADRIITLESGRLVSDSDSWQRSGLSADTETIYAGDYQETQVDTASASLRILQEPGSEPVNLTVIVRGDRIVVKLDDERTASCSRSQESPQIMEGFRPKLHLETLENENIISSVGESENAPGGKLTLSTMFAEAKRLLRSRGTRLLSRSLFLILLTVMVLITIADYLEVASLNPEDFITTDSHILQVDISRGPGLEITKSIYDAIDEFQAYAGQSGLEFTYVPKVPTAAEYRVSTFLQMENLSEMLYGYSYVPLDALNESDLIYGRMPENSQEIVIDRWVLDELISRDGIIQSGLNDVSDLLNKQIYYARSNFSPTIVGISDCGEPAVFLNQTAMVSLGALGCEVITLSELRSLYPGKYDDVVLEDGECLVITNNAGIAYADRVGGTYTTDGNIQFTIAGTIEEDTYALLVVTDAAVTPLLESTATTTIYLYCQDKAAMKNYLTRDISEDFANRVIVHVTDHHSDAMAAYESSAQIRLDNRRIITFTILAVCLVMLYLLQRTCIRDRIEMIAVYRLLGIPGRKLSGIFSMECMLLSLISSLPAALLTWLTINILGQFPSLDIALLLPWYAAVAGYLLLLGIHLLVSLLPLRKLIKLPPAQLAGKYDI